MPGRFLSDNQVTATINALENMHAELYEDGVLTPNVDAVLAHYAALVTPATDGLYLSDSPFGNFTDTQLEVLSIALEADKEMWVMGSDDKDTNAVLFEAVQLEISKRPELVRHYTED